MEHQSKSDVMDKPGPEITTDRAFLEVTGYRCGLEALLEFDDPRVGKLLMGEPHELGVLQQTTHRQAIEDGFIPIRRTTLRLNSANVAPFAQASSMAA